MKNIEYLDLDWEGDRLIGKTNTPIIIENRSLGYNITCHLKTFYYDKLNQTSWTHSYLFFKEIPSKDSVEIKNWIAERQKVYSASLTKFLISFGDSATAHDNYRLHILRKQYDIRKPSDIRLIKTNNDKDSSYTLHFEGSLKIRDEKNFTRSRIELLWPRITIDKFGYPKQPRPFIVRGYWGTLGLADQLPKYFSLKRN